MLGLRGPEGDEWMDGWTDKQKSPMCSTGLQGRCPKIEQWSLGAITEIWYKWTKQNVKCKMRIQCTNFPCVNNDTSQCLRKFLNGQCQDVDSKKPSVHFHACLSLSHLLTFLYQGNSWRWTKRGWWQRAMMRCEETRNLAVQLESRECRRSPNLGTPRSNTKCCSWWRTINEFGWLVKLGQNW